MMRVVIAIGGMACLAIAGCSKSPDQTHGAVINATGEGTTINQGKPPTNLPSYAPAYPGARWSTNFENDSNSIGAGGSAHFITNDEPDAVFAFYEKAALANGLTDKTKVPTGTPGMAEEMLAQPGTTRALTVTTRSNDNGQPGTKVGLGYGPK